jgi:hypothetical protein
MFILSLPLLMEELLQKLLCSSLSESPMANRAAFDSLQIAVAGLAPTPTIRHVEGDPFDVIASLEKEWNGIVAVGADGVLRSFAYEGHVIDYRQLDQTQHQAFARIFSNPSIPVPHSRIDVDSVSFADGRTVVDHDKLMNPPIDTTPLPFLNRIIIKNPEPKVMLRALMPLFSATPSRKDGKTCSPPLYCTDSSTCTGGGCSVCTWIGWFPYGMCLGGGN